MTQISRDHLKDMFGAAIKAVSGKESVLKACKSDVFFGLDKPCKPDMIISVGKAASDMCEGALEYFGDVPALVATKYGHAAKLDTKKSAHVTLIEAAHPVPDENSLRAGKMLIDTVSAMDEESILLLLVSGGASAIAEVLPSGMCLKEFQELTSEMVSGGLTIAQINKKRRELSLIKGGKLLKSFKGKRVIIYAISDVEGDHISVIGSGIGDPKLTNATSEVRLIATNEIARKAAAQKAEELGFTVKSNVEALYNDVYKLAMGIGKYVSQSSAGIYIWGGEPTIILPKNPGNGGRNQSLALSLAKVISGTENITILAAGTDGNDGPTDAAGGIIDGHTFDDEATAMTALEAANAGEFLRNNNEILITGPTGTNVMDLVIVLVEEI